MVELGKAPAAKPWWLRSWALPFGVIGVFFLLMYLLVDDGDSKPASTAPGERPVSRADVTPWPFTADSGTLRCRTHSGITFQPVGGSEYALNGSAETIGYPALPASAWALDPQLGNGLRVSVSGAIAAGSALC